jgi:hypothetical protein
MTLHMVIKKLVLDPFLQKKYRHTTLSSNSSKASWSLTVQTDCVSYSCFLQPLPAEMRLSAPL